MKAKRQGFGLDIRSFKGKKGESYLVFRSLKGSFHVFQEVEAKDAARKCGASANVRNNTRSLWESLWK